MTKKLKATDALVDQLADALFRVEEHLEVEAAFPTADLDTNIAFLATLVEQKQRLAAIVNEVERITAKQMPAKTYSQNGFTAEKNSNWKTVWDVRPAAWAVVEPACVDQESGEVLVEEKAAWGIVDRLLSSLHVDYFRVSALRDLGIDPDEYRQREWLRTTVKVTRADEAGAA